MSHNETALLSTFTTGDDSQYLAKVVDTGLVPVEEAVKHVVPQIGNCVCLPTRYKAGDIVIHVQSATPHVGGKDAYV
eukprot:2624585-Ditylum_brightwellii.AAC.1